METSFTSKQTTLFGERSLTENSKKHGPSTPAETWNEELTKRALDELFSFARKYQSGKSYRELMDFISRFHFYKPYNGMLVDIQMPGARYVAPAHCWFEKYGRRVRPNAQPILILQPGGPVMFVFDVADTDPGPEAKPLPGRLKNLSRYGGAALLVINLNEPSKTPSAMACEFCYKRRDLNQQDPFLSRMIKAALHPFFSQVGNDRDGNPFYERIPVRYNLVLNEKLSREARYATIVHEFGHLYCGLYSVSGAAWGDSIYQKYTVMEVTFHPLPVETSGLIRYQKRISNNTGHGLQIGVPVGTKDDAGPTHSGFPDNHS